MAFAAATLAMGVTLSHATAAAGAGIRKETVQFAKGASSVVLTGRLKGDALVDYVIRAGAGQTLTAKMTQTNPQNYFNVLPPDSGGEAMFVGSMDGDYSGVLPTDGDYVVRVYLMRPAARRGESSDYSLNVSVTGEALPPVAASVDALIPGTPFHASAPIKCVPFLETTARECPAFVIRRGLDGTGTVEIPPESARCAERLDAVRASRYSERAVCAANDACLLVLASASPRRRELLARAGLAFEVLAADIPETARPGEAPHALVERLAAEKAVAVRRRLPAAPRRLVLGSDTVVVLEGEILGKPRDAEDAVGMLRRLTGRTHTVWTGIAVLATDGGAARVRSVESRVTMHPATEAELVAYVATGEPHDKAGAYALQGEGRRFIAHVAGSESNVIGLPVEETLALLAAAGLDASSG